MDHLRLPGGWSRWVCVIIVAGLSVLLVGDGAHLGKVSRRSVDGGCSRGDFSCSNTSSECIPHSWACDGDGDCSQGEDELPSLCDNRTCADTYFLCDTNKCVPCEFVRDGFPDCEDETDESQTTSCTLPPTT